jgi:hypothetical protein
LTSVFDSRVHYGLGQHQKPERKAGSDEEKNACFLQQEERKRYGMSGIKSSCHGSFAELMFAAKRGRMPPARRHAKFPEQTGSVVLSKPSL